MTDVREAGPEEWPAVADLTRLSYAELAPDPDGEFWTAYEASTRHTLLTDPASARLVLDVDGQLAAAVLLCPPSETNPDPEMRLLAVHPGHRDAGLGGRLITECERRVRAQGGEVITLHTTVLMQTAKAMYERRGYTRSPELDFEPAPGFVVWGYRKRLG